MSFAPKVVFISYSQTSTDYIDWVEELARRIQSDSFDVRLDQWYLREGDDVYAFMESMVTDKNVAKVIILCDPRYAERADTRKGGIGVESTIISQELYGQVAKTKFVPVIARRDEKGEAALPVFLKSRYYIDLSHDDPARFEQSYEQLLRALDDKPVKSPPPIGARPRFLDETVTSTSPTTFKARAAQSAISENRASARGLMADYLDAVRVALEAMAIENTVPRSDVESVWWRSLEEWTPRRDEFIDMIGHMARYSAHQDNFALLPPFFEGLLPLTQDTLQRRHIDHLEFLVYEMFLYAFTVLVRAGKWGEAGLLLNSHYHQPEEVRGAPMQRFSVFRADSEALVAFYRKKTGTKWYSPLGQLLRDRATHPQIRFEHLHEPDILLFLRYCLESRGSWRMLSWPARTWPYFHDRALRYGHGENRVFFDFAVRARSQQFFEQMKPVFGVHSKTELLEKWQPMLEQGKGFLQPHSGEYDFSLSAQEIAELFQQMATEY